MERGLAKAYTNKTKHYKERSYADRFEAGLASPEPTLAAARGEAHALLSRLDATGLAAASLETLAVAERMVWELDHEASLCSSIAAARGLPDAVEAVARATLLRIGTHDGDYTSSLVVLPATEKNRLHREPCLPLRHLVCAAPEAEYAAARERAERLRSDGDLRLRSWLAYTFPDEDWANADLEAALAQGAQAETNYFLLSAVSESALVRRWAETKGAFNLSVYALNLACALPPAEAVTIFAECLPELLVKPKYGPLAKTPPRDMAQALACIGTKEAAAVLATYASHPVLAPVVLAFFRERPEHGAALQTQAKGKGKLEAAAARVLAKRKVGAEGPTAKPDDLPPVLRDPPWRATKSTEKPIVVDGLAPLGLDLERVALVRPPTPFAATHVRDMTVAELAAWKKEAAAGETIHADYQYRQLRLGTWEYLRIPDHEGLWAWNEKNGYLHAGPLAWVERHGLAALPGFLARDWVRWLAYEGYDEYVDAVWSLVAPRTAPMVARVASRKRWRRVANTWLVEHAEVAALGLIPDALSDRKEPRAHAEAALLMLARHGKDDIVRKAAKAYGEQARRGIEVLLARDPLAIASSVPKPPDFLHVGELPRVKTRAGQVLDEAALGALVEMLQLGTVEDPYLGIELVRQACDVASLGDLAIELAEQWVIGDAPGRHEWMLHAVVHFRSDRGTRRVAELAREWAYKNLAKAERACGALAADGSDLALMHLAHIAETTRFDTLKKTAGELVRDAAAARGLTEAELGDRTVPDAGLGPSGTIELSYGERVLVVGCDASLRPVVREKTKTGLGPPERSLPRPLKTDDAAKVKEARERFDQLKKDLGTIGQRQARRLERAMVEGRTWPVADFEARIVAHPLLRHLAVALVWESVPPNGEVRTFRVAEDGSFADARDGRIDLAAETSVRLAHPVRTPELVELWSTVFADYEIVQPFEQLGRGRHAPTPTEKKEARLESAGAITVPARTLLGTM
ncbi:MAG: Molybdate metabolism regulator, partial [Labilithrix sp.]|nr:Molybdate metabolism regulator [Labilithrix sp.]